MVEKPELNNQSHCALPDGVNVITIIHEIKHISKLPKHI